MVDRVLVPMDGSEMAEHALDYALELYPEASITALHVVGEPSGMMGQATRIAVDDDPAAVAEDLAEPVFARARDIAGEHDAEVDTRVAIGAPARAIVDRAGEYDAVVLGSHGGDLASRLLTGNVAERVFRRSPVPVTVVR